MTPDFRIIAQSKDVTDMIRDRLLSLTIKDEAGLKADSVELMLDDRDGRMRAPPEGATLEVFIGYKGQSLYRMGLYICDEVEMTGPPDAMRISGKAADVGGALKGQKTRGWDHVTIGDIVARIASEHDLEPVVSDTLSPLIYRHIDQTDESDIHFLTRIARDHDAMVSVKEGHLLFTTKGDGLTATGKSLPVMRITPADHTTHRMCRMGREKYAAFKAHWSDKKGGKRRTVIDGEGEPVCQLRHTYASEEEAIRAAAARRTASERGQATLSVALPGAPMLAAEHHVEMAGFRIGVDAIWAITSVSHTLSGSGFKTALNATAIEEKKEG